MRIALLLGAVCLMAAQVRAGAQQSDTAVDGFLPRVHQAKHGITMPYRLFIPANYDKTKKYPIIIWLHGAGGAGDDNLLEIEGDQVFGTHKWTDSAVQAAHPAFVFVPQAPGIWASIDPKKISDQEQLVMDILDGLRKEFSIDPARMYITGQSNGGYGVWDLITKKPGVFAAGIAIAGGGQTKLASKAIYTPIWAFHGDKDSVIPVDESREMVAAVKKAGGRPRYTEYKGRDHDIWPTVFQETALVDWLFSQHK